LAGVAPIITSWGTAASGRTAGLGDPPGRHCSGAGNGVFEIGMV